MTDKQPTQAVANDGDDGRKPVASDGVSDTGGAGESGGGSYDNPHTGKGDPGNGGFMGHGGQSHIDYSGPGEKAGADNDNAAVGSE